MRKTLFLLALLIAGNQARSQILSNDLKTPAQQKIGWATAEVKAHPDEPQPYNDLAVALVDRGRETGDPDFYDQAETAVQASLRRDPHNFEGRKAKAMILLGRGDFQEAIELTRKLNTEVPDDVLVYGLLADGFIETGHYEEAVDRTQWMLNLRSGNVPGLLRAARLRWIYGDKEGALDLYSRAYQELSTTQTEDQARVLTQMAQIQMATGQLDLADRLLHSARDLFPDYYLSLEASAQLEMMRKHYPQAVALLRQRNARFPTLQSRFALARALERAGETAEAKAVYAEFEDKALRLSDAPNNANRELIFYYLSNAGKPAEALRIAAKEAGKRQDIATLDAYAWALSINGENAQAEKQIKLAMATGIHDAAILYHAGVIAKKRQDNVSAARYLNASLEVNPESEMAQDARLALQTTTAMPVPAAAN